MRLLLAALAALSLAVGGWSWYRTRPDPNWLCETDSPMVCVADVRLEVEGLGDAPRIIEVDVSGSPTRIAAVVRVGEGSEQRFTLALFDSEGRLVRQLVPDTFWVDSPRFSTDGTLVAVEHSVINEDPAERTGLVVEMFDTANGASVSAHRFAEPGFDCVGRLGISPDNTEYQCASAVRDLQTHELLETLGSEANRWAGAGYGDWAASGLSYRHNWMADEFQLLEVVGDERRVLRTFDVETDPIFPTADSSFTDSLSPTTDQPRLVLLGARDDEPWHVRWRRTARSFSLGTVVIVADGEPGDTVELGFTPDEVGWTADDDAVWILDRDEATVVVAQPTS